MNEVHSVETEEEELQLKDEKETNQIIPSESEEALQLREAEVIKSVQKEKVENIKTQIELNKLYKNANSKIESNELQDSGAGENDIGSESGKESNKLYLGKSKDFFQSKGKLRPKHCFFLNLPPPLIQISLNFSISF